VAKPYDARGGIIGCGICPCCLWEPGYDDDAGASGAAKATIHGSIRAYRQAWLAAGHPWRSQFVRPPDDWSGLAQLTAFLEIAGHLG
jgi:hypothetical protein